MRLHLARSRPRLDTVGSDEAIDVSLAVVADRKRVVTIAAPHRAKSDGLQWIGGSNPKSGPYRASQRVPAARDGRGRRHHRPHRHDLFHKRRPVGGRRPDGTAPLREARPGGQ